MNARNTTLALLALSFVATGCATDGAPSSSVYEQLNADGASYAADLSDPNSEMTQAPRIETFSAQPGVLPVGGGEVQVSWTSRHSVACSLSVEGREVKVDFEGVNVAPLILDKAKIAEVHEKICKLFGVTEDRHVKEDGR